MAKEILLPSWGRRSEVLIPAFWFTNRQGVFFDIYIFTLQVDGVVRFLTALSRLLGIEY